MTEHRMHRVSWVSPSEEKAHVDSQHLRGREEDLSGKRPRLYVVAPEIALSREAWM